MSPDQQHPELGTALHSWSCLGVTQRVRKNSEHEFNLVRAPRLMGKGRIALLPGRVGRRAQARVPALLPRVLAEESGRDPHRGRHGQMPTLPGAALGKQRAATPGASVVCSLYAACSGTFKRELLLQMAVQTEPSFSPFLSLHRAFSLSWQRALVCRVPGTAAGRSAAEVALPRRSLRHALTKPVHGKPAEGCGLEPALWPLPVVTAATVSSAAFHMAAVRRKFTSVAVGTASPHSPARPCH